MLQCLQQSNKSDGELVVVALVALLRGWVEVAVLVADCGSGGGTVLLLLGFTV